MMIPESDAVKRVRAWLRAQELNLGSDARVMCGGNVLLEVSRTQAAGGRIVIQNLRRFLSSWEQAIEEEGGVYESEKKSRRLGTHGPRAGTVRVVRAAKLIPRIAGESVGGTRIA